MAARKNWIKTLEGNLLNVKRISQVKVFPGYIDTDIKPRVAVYIDKEWYTVKEFNLEQEARTWMVTTFPTK
jgi:antibiotic biosynthesis monooxygenase (ABM) superfamily enzyme